MMQVFNEVSPKINITPCSTDSEKDEQRGYRHLFAGAMAGIRNPRGHEHSKYDNPNDCLDYLALASALLRRLERANYELK